jgi:hypothetical protein
MRDSAWKLRPPFRTRKRDPGKHSAGLVAFAHLAQANRHIADLTVQIARHRVIIKDALDTGQPSEMAESLLHALEGSLRLFEKHRIFLLSSSVNGPSKRIIQAARPAG